MSKRGAGIEVNVNEEKDMDWLVQNRIWVLVFAVFIGMHMFGHGGHGGHGGCCGGGDQRSADEEQSGKDRPQGHQH